MAKKQKKKQRQFTLIVDGENKSFSYTYPSTRKDKRLQIYIPIGRKIDGTVHYKIIYGKTEDQLKENLMSYYAENKDGNMIDLLFSEAIIEWFFACRYRVLKYTTRDDMEYNIRHYIIPYFPVIKTSAVTPSMCQHMINSLMDKGLSASVINKAYVYTKQFFNYFLSNNLIEKNPMDAIEKPTPQAISRIVNQQDNQKKRKERKYLTPIEIDNLKEVIYNGYIPKGCSRKNNDYCLPLMFFYQAIVFDFLLNTGLRTNELLALKYCDWDGQKQTISITAGRTKVHKRDETNKTIIPGRIAVESDPKTEFSARTLRLSDYANSLLVFMLSQEKPGYNGYICHTENMTPIDHDILYQRWNRICRAAGITAKDEHIGLHILRHTYASFLYQQTNNMQFVSKKLRHSNPSITSKVYVDIIEGYEDKIDTTFKI